jgi:photosystem II stability/assembly factor-like uncharacterized protein
MNEQKPTRNRSRIATSQHRNVKLLLVALTSLLVVGVAGGIAIATSHSRLARGQRDAATTTTTTIAPWNVPANETSTPVVLAPGGAAGGSGNYNAVDCVSTSECVAVGGNGSLHGVAGYSTSSGGSWSSGTVVPGLPDLEALNCTSANDCVAVGAGAVAVTRDGGSNWIARSIPSSNTTLLGVSCASSEHCVSVGVSPGATGPYQGQLLVSSNGGNTWSVPTISASLGPLGSVDCPSSIFCVAVGASILVSNNGGATWTNRPVNGGTGVLRFVSCASSSTCVAIGPNPAVAQDPSASAFAVETSDGGASWNPVVMPPGTADVYALTCAGTRCYASGESTAGDSAVVAVSGDGGASWSVDSTLKPSLDEVSAMSCSSATDCLFIGRTGKSPSTVASTNGTASPGYPVPAPVRARDGAQ